MSRMTMGKALNAGLRQAMLDDEKVVKLANRLAGTASEWPDMGQDRERPDRKSGLEAGREAYRSRHRK